MTTFVLFLSLLNHIVNDAFSRFRERIIIKNESINTILKDKSDKSLLEVKPTVRKGYHSIEEEKKYSLYEKNYIIINSILSEYYEEYQKNCKELKKDSIPIEKYVEYLFNYIVNNVFFVVMETDDRKMSLSEIVKVFNTINTTGLDLNAADVFKLMFFDYHKSPDSEHEDDSLLLKIDEIFKYIENDKELQMSYVLDIYKHVLCSAPENALGFKILKMSNEAFFEYLFKKKELCEELKDYLSLESFEKLVKLTVALYYYSHNQANEGIYSLAELIISETRYSRYWTLPYVYAFFKLKDKKFEILSIDEMGSIFNESLETTFSATKYFVIYSVVKDKVINDVQNKICKDFMPSFKKEEIVELCAEKWREEFRGRLEKDLKKNDKRAYIVCLISAIVDEYKVKADCTSIREKLFQWKDSPYDIEHIKAKNNFATASEEDKQLFEGIGNLVVLERNINRNIKDKSVEEKVVYYKEKSNFISVAKVCDLFKESQNNWNLDVVKKRGNQEVEKLTKLLFE